MVAHKKWWLTILHTRLRSYLSLYVEDMCCCTGAPSVLLEVDVSQHQQNDVRKSPTSSRRYVLKSLARTAQTLSL